MNTNSQRRQPTAFRIVKKDGSSKTLKMSMGKDKLHNGDPSLARTMYQYFYINGCQYCRPHFLVKCHLCEVDATMNNDEVNDERINLGLKNAGDPRLDDHAQKWNDRVDGRLIMLELEHDMALMNHGRDYYVENPLAWKDECDRLDRDQRQINDELFQDLQILREQGVQQCCYWACDNEVEERTLKRCTGCRFAKYCSKECQESDWIWEHRGECTANVPQFILDEMRVTLERNLRGDYSN